MEAQKEIAPSALAGDFIYMEALPSTQLEVKRLLRAGMQPPFVVAADVQTQGLGRFSRNWISPPGGTYFSWATRDIEKQGASLVIAMALCRALRKVAGCTPSIKWPNDIMLAGRKLAGILTESSGNAIITGIGINTFARGALPDELADIATTVPMDSSARRRIIESFFDYLCPLWDEFSMHGFASLVNEYINMSIPLNTPISVRCGNMTTSGHFAGIGTDGELMLRLPNGKDTRAFIAGEATLQRISIQ